MQNEPNTPADKTTSAEATKASTDAPMASPAHGTAPATLTRTAGTWIGLVVGALILIVLLVFILQNNTSTPLSIFGWHFSLPLGVSMLFAALAGALIMALVGGARILQLRKAYRKKR